MFIKRIEIGQFGNLKDVAINFEPAANLIVAPNEWGKSTLIDFIFAVFYGMDRNNPRNLRSSNRSRNMPWGSDSMNGALFFQKNGLNYEVRCEFGSQPRMDNIVLIEEKLGKTIEIDSEQTLGKRIFGLGEHSFSQSVYVQQMSLALNVKDDKKGELLHQLASLGTSGASDISSAAVTERLSEALLALTSTRRQNAVIPNLESERFQLREQLAEARARETREAEELLELQALEAEVIHLAERVRSGERKLSKTEYMIQLQDLEQAVAKEQAIKGQLEQFEKHLKQVEALEPAPVGEDFIALDQEIKQLQVESSTLESISRNLEIERGAMMHELNLAFKTDSTEYSEPKEQPNFNEKSQQLRSQKQVCDKELRSAYARQQQIELNKEVIQEQAEVTAVPQTQETEKKLKVLGLVLLVLGFASALPAGIMWHPAAFSFVLISALGYYFHSRVKKIYSDRQKAEIEQLALKNKLAEAENDLTEVNAAINELEEQSLVLEEKQNALHEAKSQMLQRQQQAKIREESYLGNEKRFLERRSRFCDIIDNLIAAYPYLNTADIVKKIKSSQDLPQLDNLEYSTRSMVSVYPAELFQEDSDANKRRFNDANKLFKRFADSYFELSSYIQELKQKRIHLRDQLQILSTGQEGEQLLPSERRQLLMDKTETGDLPEDIAAMAIAIQEEGYSQELRKSADEYKRKLKQERDNYNQSLSEYSKKQAHMSLAYRYSERSENVERRLKELDDKIEKIKSRARQLELAQKYLKQADEEMRRNFSPELRNLTAKYLDKLTLGRYDDVLIDKNMKLQLHIAGETQFREAEYMSGGCYDQVYLALRLALSELITQDELPPLILDDVLVQFDEVRMEAALSLLAEISREKSDDNSLGGSRQILLFSCHDRVAEKAATLNNYAIQKMKQK